MAHLKDLQGMIRNGVNSVMAGYEQIKRDANPNVLGTASDAIKRAMGGAYGTTRSGAPRPNKGRPLK